MGASGIMNAMKNLTLDRVLGLSATPLRLWDDNNENLFIEEILNSKPPYTFQYDMSTAIKNGALVEYNYYPSFVYTQTDEFEQYCLETQNLFRYVDGERKINSQAARRRQMLIDTVFSKKNALRQIVKKGQGAYYSSGSRPNQSGHSWGRARLASSITGGKAAAVDFHILEKTCKKGSKALKLAKKVKGKGTRRVKKVKIGGKWTKKYKKNINCKNPKGFSQKQHCNYGRVTRKAKATFNKKNNVSGEVLFEEVKKGIKVTYDFKGLKNGKHGFHVHEKGNFNGDCNKAGPHFNPSGHSHAGRKSRKRHIGDLGNVITKNRVTRGSFIDKKISLKGKNNIIGRSVIVHYLKDDLGKGKNKESLKTGNAGARLNCAKILKSK